MTSASTQTKTTAIAVFDDRDDALDAINDLKQAGFSGDAISLVARQRDTMGGPSGARISGEAHPEEHDNAAGEGAVAGAVTGGVLGGLGGFLVGIGALAIPAIGPVIAAGAFATALAGVAAGAGVGAVAGALVGMSVPGEEAEWYEERVRGGAWLVTVSAGGRYDEAMRILRDNGGRDYAMARTPATARAWDEIAPEFRSDYERQYGTGRRWTDREEQYEPAHRFGYEAYNQVYGQGSSEGTTMRSWNDVEPDLRRDWEQRGQGAWEQAREHVRHGYDYGRGRRRFHDESPEQRRAA